MSRAEARLILSAPDRLNTKWEVQVISSNGYVQYPSLFRGKVYYDQPEIVPEGLKPKIQALLYQAADRNNRHRGRGLLASLR